MNIFHAQVLQTVDRLDKDEAGVHQEAIVAELPWDREFSIGLIKELAESGDLYPVERRVYKNISPWSGA